jgi:CheY-like chemotaxis protein
MHSKKMSLKNYGAKKILIIDDDQDLKGHFQQLFELEDYLLITAKDGREALDLLEGLSDHDLPDLILLDFNMPVMNGEDFGHIKNHHSRFSHIPMILITANGELSKIMEKVEAEAYLDKPLSIDQLLKLTFNFIHRFQNSRYSFIT